MRRFLTLLLICLLFVPSRAEAFFQKKDYKQIFLNDAYNAEKRHNNKSAFHSYEKAIYYYKKDKKVVEAYAKFCERQEYFDKAQDLYSRLYILTKDKEFLFKANLCAIKNGKLSGENLKKLVETKGMSPAQKNELNSALVYHFSFKEDWSNVKKTCDKIPKNAIGKEIITTCIVATEKAGDKKNSLGYYLRFSQIHPKDSEAVNKIISLAEQFNNYPLQEKYIKKLSDLNPKDSGIKYRLAGLYEKHRDWRKAAKVYEALMVGGDRSEHVKISHAYVLSQLNPKAQPKIEKYVSKPRVLTEREKKENQLYSALQNKNYKKTLEITEELLQKYPDDKKLLTLAMENSMATQNWDKALIYTDKLLTFEPNSEGLLKNKANLYSINKDFANAIAGYEKLMESYPKSEYSFALANLYMANQDFAKAQAIFEPIYNANPENPVVVDAFLSSLLAQQKIRQAYWIIKTHHLEKTKEGYLVFGDMAMTDKDYYTASSNYRNAIALDPENIIFQTKLAESYRMLGYINKPTQIYKNVLQKDPENLQAKLGLGYLEVDKKNFEKARGIFNGILGENPDYRPAKMAIAHSYIANDDKLSALDALNQIPPDDETELMKAQTYYNMNMLSTSKRVLNGVVTKDAEELKYKIRRDEAITVIPSYMFLFQQLADEFKLDYHKFGIQMAKAIEGNKNVFMEYNVYIYSSGGLNQLNNVVNEFRSGVQARPTKKWEYRADLGVKSFEFGNGAMINTDSWIKHYFSDKFNLKLGIRRNNIEQSYVSAVGQDIDGIFTGRAADNRLYLEFEGKLPHQFYTFGRGSYGVITAQNMQTNQYFEGMVGIGKLFYNNPKNKWVNTFGVDLVSYNSGYQYDLLKIYNSAGLLFGGYFSPSYFNATTLNLKLEGYIKKWHLHYGLKGFGGIQNALSPDQTTPTWGYSPYISYDLNDNVSINASYNHFTYADIERDQFMINAVIRGFKKHAKN
ncbi:MAG: tetratricopeptide repeat protein [Candidatus Gastranaerophilaceae bacterium]